MLKVAKSWLKKPFNRYLSAVCRQEFEGQVFTRFNERPIELSFVFRKLGEIYPRTILDVGTGSTALPHMMRNCGFLVTATDNVRDYWPSGMVNRHFHVIDDDITSTTLKSAFDLITCISVIEHIEGADTAFKNMISLLRSNGHLIMTFPYNELSYARNVYALPGSSYGKDAPYITQSFSRSNVDSWVRENHVSIIEQEYWKCWEGEYWTIGNQIIPPERVTVNGRHQLTCLHIQKP